MKNSTLSWKAIASGGAGLLAFAALLAVIFVPKPVKVQLATAATGRFEETIQSDGILRSKEHFIVPAFADGDIKRVSLKPGDAVKKGQVITRLFWDVKFDPVRAPISGVITKVFRESAGPIRRGDPIVEIVDPKRLEIMAELLTSDAVRLKVGAPVTLKNWADGPPVHALVSRISKAGFIKQSALGVEEERTEVTADLLNQPAEFLARAGNVFHVDASFQVSEAADVLKIPVGALFREGRQWAVYQVGPDNRARRRTVTLLGMNPSEAAVQEGLQAGDKVIVFPGDLVKEGTRIRAE